MKLKIAASAIIMIAISMFIQLDSYSTENNSDNKTVLNIYNTITVTALHGGAPANGAQVTMSNAGYSITGTTQSDGKVVFNNVPAGTYKIYGIQYTHTGEIKNAIIGGSGNYSFQIDLNIEG